MRKRGLIIAIDGPSASGKSTTAHMVAQRLGYRYVDSGAMYRAVTLKAIREGIDLTREEEVVEMLARMQIDLVEIDGVEKTFLDGVDVSEEIRTPEITNRIAPISAMRSVREALVERQRAMGQDGGIVMDGRDIGTVVFPDADLKIFLSADLHERVIRRQRELAGKGIMLPLEQVEADMKERDRQNVDREYGPERQAADAVFLDTVGLSIDQQVETVVMYAVSRGASRVTDAR
ncbi:MAG: (d)CMP kinase [Candidatus Latescibacteria bacterium]|nr:(d)CMP kinase [Candidatus Latescibacterota bacterium]